MLMDKNFNFRFADNSVLISNNLEDSIFDDKYTCRLFCKRATENKLWENGNYENCHDERLHKDC